MLKRSNPDVDAAIISCEYNAYEIAERFNYHPGSVKQRARQLGVKLPNNRDKYNVNQDFFKIWTKEMAYVVGFLAADGCVTGLKKYGPKILRIRLKDTDWKFLEQIKEIISSTHKIHISTDKRGYGYADLSISCRILCNDLINIGIVPRKTQSLKWIDQCPIELVNHMIRGYLDGDGYIGICKAKSGNNFINVGILGTESFTTGIYKVYGGNKPIQSDKRTPHLYSFRLGGSKALSFLDWLYKDSTELTRLSRKYDIYLEYKNKMTAAQYA